MADAVFCGQHLRHRLEKVVIHFPSFRVARIAPYSGVRHIKHIVQTRVSAGFVQQGDALGATPDIPVHAVVPDVVIGAGCGIGSLSVDHQLVGKAILVQPGCCGQIVRPAFPVPRQAVCRALGKSKIFFGFARHCCLLPVLSIKIAGNRFMIARRDVILFFKNQSDSPSLITAARLGAVVMLPLVSMFGTVMMPISSHFR